MARAGAMCLIPWELLLPSPREESGTSQAASHWFPSASWRTGTSYKAELLLPSDRVGGNPGLRHQGEGNDDSDVDNDTITAAAATV